MEGILIILALMFVLGLGLQLGNVLISFPHIVLFTLAVSAGALWLVAWVILSFQMREFLGRHHVQKVVTIASDAAGIRFTIDRDYLDLHEPLRAVLWVSVAAAVVVAWVVVYQFYAHDQFDRATLFEKPAPPYLNFFFTGLLVSVVIVVLRNLAFEEWVRRIRDTVLDRRITRLLSKLSKDVNSQLAELNALQTDIGRLCGDFGVSPCRNFLKQGTQHLITTLADSVRDGSGKSVNVSHIIANAKAEKRHIETATTLYRQAVDLATEIERHVHAQGSHSFLDRYDALYDGLYSPNLQSLVLDQEWENFSDIVRSFVDDFETLRADLSCYQDADDQDDEHVHAPTELTVEQACRILSVPPTATGDQVKKSYRTLCALWHPDKGLVTDDEQIKRINQAYAFLQSTGHIGSMGSGGNHAKA